MANSITVVETYKPIIDAYYAKYDNTNVFDNTAEYISNGQYRIMKVGNPKLGNYTKNTGGAGSSQHIGYAGADVVTSWEIIKGDTPRSVQLVIDKIDDEKSFNMALEANVKAFLQQAVIEHQARRHAKIANKTGITTKAEAIATAAELRTALRAALNQFDNNAVPTEDRVLIILPALYALLVDDNSYTSKAVLEECGTIIKARPEVMETKINLLPNNGWTVDETSKTINFMLIQKDAVITGMQTEVKFFNDGELVDFRGSVFDYYENPLDGYVYDNKVDGVYVSTEV